VQISKSKSTHESSGNRVKCLCDESIEVWYMEDELRRFNTHLMVENFYETWWMISIILKLKLYKFLASLPCYLSVFVFLSVMIVFYTGAYEIVGNRAPQWAVGGLDRFKLNALLCFIFKLFDVYIKFLWRGISFFFLRYKYEKTIYVYMLIKYCMHNILANMGIIKDVTETEV